MNVHICVYVNTCVHAYLCVFVSLCLCEQTVCVCVCPKKQFAGTLIGPIGTTVTVTIRRVDSGIFFSPVKKIGGHALLTHTPTHRRGLY